MLCKRWRNTNDELVPGSFIFVLTTTPRKEIRFKPPHLDKIKSMAFQPHLVFFPGKALSKVVPKVVKKG
jgi:hypothetical protein